MPESILPVRPVPQRPDRGDVPVPDRLGSVADLRRAAGAQLRARLVLHDRRLPRLADSCAWLGPASERLLAGGARGGARRRAARRRRRARAAAPPLRPRGALPAAVHLCAGADPRRCRQAALGHAAALRARVRRVSPARSSCSARWCPTTICSSSLLGPAHRARLLVLLQRTGTRPHGARRRARPRDARRARRQCRLALHRRCSWSARSWPASAGRW